MGEDICLSSDIDPQYQGVPARQQAYVQACSSSEDLDFWSVNHFEAKKYSKTESKLSKTMAKSLPDSSSKSASENISTPLGESSPDSSSKSANEGSGGAKVFFIGLLMGVAVPVAMLMYYTR